MAPGLVDSSSQKSTCPRHPHAPQSTATESQRHRLMNGLWRWGPATAHRLRLLSGEEMTADDQSTPATGSLATCEAHVRRRLVPGCDHDRVADILARVSRLFSFAVERDWIEANPALRIVKPSDEKSRDRVLSRDELRELWTALHQIEAKDANGKRLPRLSQTMNDAFIVMLLTAQRCGEVCRMQ